jgi:ABC-type Zn uptake system ZnuABC Zn-binding protein ZnuA
MKRLKQTFWLLLGVAAGVVLLGIVYFRAGKVLLQAGTGKLTVAGTIYPLYDMARTVAGEEGVVKLIVPPGASPHLFEFSPRKLKELQNVKAVFAIGHGLDNWATQITNVVKGAQVVVMDQGIELRTFEDGTTDPHYWLHFGNAQKITDNIANALIEMDPAHAEAYRENARTYKGKLAEKEREMKGMLAPAQGMPILTFHDAWFYFAENFGLRIAGTFETAAGEEPTPRYLAELHRKIETEQIHIIFIEPQLSTGVLESFAKDNKVGIAVLDPLGGVQGRTTYLELMLFNANSVQRAVQQQSP